jgi:hypothetical protein
MQNYICDKIIQEKVMAKNNPFWGLFSENDGSLSFGIEYVSKTQKKLTWHTLYYTNE